MWIGGDVGDDRGEGASPGWDRAPRWSRDIGCEGGDEEEISGSGNEGRLRQGEGGGGARSRRRYRGTDRSKAQLAATPTGRAGRLRPDGTLRRDEACDIGTVRR